jgi:hypothetical protein
MAKKCGDWKPSELAPMVNWICVRTTLTKEPQRWKARRQKRFRMHWKT